MLCDDFPFYDEDDDILDRKIQAGIFRIPFYLDASVVALLTRLIVRWLSKFNVTGRTKVPNLAWSFFSTYLLISSVEPT
ncbi:Uncharacterised protein g7598 [Pycnogonum litorale]